MVSYCRYLVYGKYSCSCLICTPTLTVRNGKFKQCVSLLLMFCLLTEYRFFCFFIVVIFFIQCVIPGFFYFYFCFCFSCLFCPHICHWHFSNFNIWSKESVQEEYTHHKTKVCPAFLCQYHLIFSLFITKYQGKTQTHVSYIHSKCILQHSHYRWCSFFACVRCNVPLVLCFRILDRLFFRPRLLAWLFCTRSRCLCFQPNVI